VWTYERLAAEAERLARGLAARGVGPGDRVAIHMMNRPEMVVAYYACFKLGSIAAPLRTAFKFAELTPILQRLKPALYIGDADLYGSVAPVEPSILALDKRFIVNGAIEDHGMQRWETLFDATTDVSFPDSTASCKPALLIITSGTTGQPKFVVHTPATLSESVELVVKHWGLSDDDVMIEPLPMAHMSGLITFLSLIRFGAPFVLLEGFDADNVLGQHRTPSLHLVSRFPGPVCGAARVPASPTTRSVVAASLSDRSRYLPDRSAGAGHCNLWRTTLQHLGCNRRPSGP